MKKVIYCMLLSMFFAGFAYGAYDQTAPSNTEKPATEGPKMRENFSLLATNHTMTGTGTTDVLTIVGSGAKTALTISQTVGTGVLLKMTNSGSGGLISLTQSGTGSSTALAATCTATANAVTAIFTQNHTTTNCVNITKLGAGSGGNALNINNSGKATTLYILHAGGAGSTGSYAIDVANNSDNSGINLSQNVALASGSYSLRVYSNMDDGDALAKFHVDNSHNENPAILVTYDGTATASGAALVRLTNNGTGAAHMQFNVIADCDFATEGGLYADDDGIMYYRNNSAWAACNAAGDFAELLESKLDASNYEDGDVVAFDNQGKIIKTTTAYQTDVIGLISDKDGRSPFKVDRRDKIYKLDKKQKKMIEDKPESKRTKLQKKKLADEGKNFSVINSTTVQVGLIGIVSCKVNNENGPIKVGNLLTSSSTPGVAMKATIDSFDKIGSVIGKAMENASGATDTIDAIVGVK